MKSIFPTQFKFKFKPTANILDTVKFIQVLVSRGYETVGTQEDFITRYVMSGDVYGYAIEDNRIVIFLNVGNENDYNVYDIPEVNPLGFIADISIDNSIQDAIENRKRIATAIKALHKLSADKLTKNQIQIIEAIPFTCTPKIKK